MNMKIVTRGLVVLALASLANAQGVVVRSLRSWVICLGTGFRGGFHGGRKYRTC